MTFIEATRPLFPKADDATIDSIIWSCSAFPFAPWKHCFQQLKGYSKRSKKDPDKAMLLADEDLNAAMDGYRKSTITKHKNEQPNPKRPVRRVRKTA